MDVEKLKELKAKAIVMLKERLQPMEQQLRTVDDRLWNYLKGCTDGDIHCCSEVLCCIKFLRIFSTYDLDVDWVKRVFRMYEGRWEHDDAGWHYIQGSGGLQFSSLRGRTYYRLQPFQLFILTWIFGFYHDVKIDTNGERSLLPTEHIGDDGLVYDRRRLVTEAVIYIPRKAGKTTLGAFIQFVMFFFSDANGEIYCAANSASQSKIIFDMVFDLVHQLDPQEKRVRFTASQINWKRGQLRHSKIEALTAGGKAKDGMNPLSVASDEFGSADWTNEHCDMVDLLNVLYSGMGVRREPLVTHTTTAGHATNGPFYMKLEGIKRVLAQEVENPLGDGDFQACILLEPDEWERDEEKLFTDEKIWRKVNPMIGISVQPDFYKKEIARTMLDQTKKKETITKLFNVYASERLKEWDVKPERVRRLQLPIRTIDCRYADGWTTFVGLDFSSGEDLFAITYLSVNFMRGSDNFGKFFADCEAWIIESELQRSPNRRLYELWIKEGWLHVCPGEVFNPDYAINELMSKNEFGVNLGMFGYDPAQSKQPINTIKAWLQSLGIDAETIQSMVVPVQQNYMTFNGLVGELEYMTLSSSPRLFFSNSPLWPWEFGNVKIEESKEGLRKVMKSQADNKVDNIHALIDALYCFDLNEGKTKAIPFS